MRKQKLHIVQKEIENSVVIVSSEVGEPKGYFKKKILFQVG